MPLKVVLMLLALGGCAYREVEMIVPASGERELVRASRHESLPLDGAYIRCGMLAQTGPDQYVCGTSRYWIERSRRRRSGYVSSWGFPRGGGGPPTRDSAPYGSFR